METYFVNGELVPADKAVISVNDLAVLRSFAVFDYLRTYNRKPFHLNAHIERLLNSARLIDLPVVWPKEKIAEAVLLTLEHNPQLDEAAIRIMLTGGESQDGTVPEGKGQLIVSVMPKPELPAAWYAEGVKVITVPFERFLPGAKSTNYLSAVKAQQQAKAAGAIEAVYVDRNGNLLEGTTTNIFGVRDGRVVTPGADLLPGVTRRVVLDLLAGEVEIAPLNYGELGGLEEAFISASNKEIVPVVAIDDTVIGGGQVGPKVKEIMRRFNEYTQAFGLGQVEEL